MSRKFGRILLFAVLQTAFWCGILLMDPFGMATAADRASEDIYLRFYASFYPGTHSDQIQIVTIRPKDPSHPRGEGLDWPPDYSDYVNLFQKVLSLKPKAVFVDLFFRKDQSGGRDASPLLAFVKDQKPGDPPFVFADLADSAYAHGSTQRVYDEIHRLEFEHGTKRRGIAQLAVREHLYPSDRDNSAATVLYKATHPQSRIGAFNMGPNPFLVAWSNVPSPVNAGEQPCTHVTPGWLGHWEWVSFAGLAGLKTKIKKPSDAGDAGWSLLQPCLPHGHVDAGTVLDLPPDVPDSRFEGKYVLIGADILGSGDRIESPVHGQVPGVYLHAMALDNLLTFGGTSPFIDAEWIWLVQALLILIIAIMGRLAFEDWKEPEDRMHAARALALRFTAWVAVAVAILTLMFGVPLGPNNWGSIVAIAGAIFFSGAFRDFYVLLFGGTEKEYDDD